MCAMAADVLPFDVYKNNAYSENVKFDLSPSRTPTPSGGTANIVPSEDLTFDPEISIKTTPSKDWELDVRGLTSTKKWLQNYGLKKNRLDMHHLLPQIGFRHSEDFEKTFKKPICSRYGSSLFQKCFRADGKTFNITVSKDKLRQIESRLQQAIHLYKRRLEWLTSESRRVFGIIEEKSIAFVLDINNMSPSQFDQYLSALERLLKEQVSSIAKFNLIRASEDLVAYSHQCQPVSQESIEGALQWVRKLDRCAPISKTATCEAIMKAMADQNVESIYLVSEGTACDGSRELLKEKLTGARIPVHVVSYNCSDSQTISFLKDLSAITGGRFHAYAVIMEMDSYEGLPVDPHTNQANILLRRKTYGGVPPGAGVREDVILLFEELEAARSNLGQIQALIEELPEKPSPDKLPIKNQEMTRSETYMSSREWLEKHGLKSKNLGFYDILSGVAFKHQDGVVSLKVAPGEDVLQTDAITKKKLVNARYCEKFPHVRWKDGTVVHVQVTPEIHRDYEKRMLLALESIQQRVDWLCQGSRELFGTVIEDQIYILIDTSSSMLPHMQFVKDKLFVLMQEQLRHKQKFNLVGFDSRACAWKDHLVEVDEKNLHQAWSWIKSLSCKGSTNTMAALRLALNDINTQAVYLLTDGRPDQPPKSILAQVQLHPQVPIHAISFNCADRDANEFLCQLAQDTGGRFHYYSEDGIDPEGPEPWESEDIRLLKQEMETGYRNLDKVAILRDECAALAWRKDEPSPAKNSRDQALPEKGRVSAVPPLDPSQLYRVDDKESLERPSSAPGFRRAPAPPQHTTPRPATAHGFRAATRARMVVRPTTARSPKRSKQISASKLYQGPLTAGHTRTSMLRSLSGRGGRFEEPEWLLPETQELFLKQHHRQQAIADKEEKLLKSRARRTNKMASEKNMSSRKWLKKHGLSAQKLTILDALSPTFIPHKPKYIPIINKTVMSKVFDDIMPLAHASDDRKKLRIVNPQGVNLDVYIKEVQQAVTKYTRRLDRIVWEALPKEEKEQFESEEPVDFIEKKLELMQALDRCGWPIREQDVILLENEIKQGETYIQQAKDLREAAQNRGASLEGDLEKYDDAASVASGASGKQYEGMGEAMEKKSPEKKKKVKMTSFKVKKALDTLRGQKIIGRSEVDGFYYPGFVIKCPDARHALVEYDDIGQQTVPTRFVIPVSGAITRPPIRIGDYVLARVVNQDTGLECYVPGIVQMTPRRMEDQAKFFTVVLYTGASNHFLRTHLMKISKMRYTFLVRYISDVSPENDDVQDMEYNFQLGSGHGRNHVELASQFHNKDGSVNSKGSRSRSPSRSPSRSRSRSRSPSDNSAISDEVSSRRSDEAESRRLDKWQSHLMRQQRKQDGKQKRLKKQAKKLSDLRKKLENSKLTEKGDGEEQKLLQMILEELNKAKMNYSSSEGSHDRTKEWIDKQNNGDSPIVSGNFSVDSKDVAPFLLEMRKSLPVLRVGEEVLARWSDEGWYYRGTIHLECGDGSYFIEDSVGDLEKIWREDLIADNDDANQTIQAKDTVIALHPSYSFSYAPAAILDVDSEMWHNVRFYDGVEGRIPREEVFRIPSEKFELDVQYILQCEERWVGQAVVARNDHTGIFQLGAARERVGNGRQYTIEWSDGTMSAQSATFIFGALTKRHQLGPGDRLLAIADKDDLLYLPGIVKSASGDKLEVRFCDGTKSTNVKAADSFWLSQEYYDSVVTYYKSKTNNRSPQTQSSDEDFFGD